MLSSSDFDVLDFKKGLDKQLFFGKHNTIEPSAIKYLAECYSRAVNECKPAIWKRGRAEDDHFIEVKESILNDCQKDIVERAR